eukprot:3138833-Lingulodinium_polyedra.AAC.1
MRPGIRGSKPKLIWRPILPKKACKDADKAKSKEEQLALSAKHWRALMGVARQVDELMLSDAKPQQQQLEA